MTNCGTASDRDETTIGESKEDTPVREHSLMERVLARANLFYALGRVRENKGAPGVDGMTVERLPLFLKKHWPDIRQELLLGRYKPKPVKRISIPKPGGGTRNLGIPTVLDRFIQQALLQVLQEEWDPTFSESSYGFRPSRSAHQALRQTQKFIREGYTWVVDMDLEKFFDRVNHDKLMHRIKQRVSDKRVLVLINRFLKSGVVIDGEWHPTTEGTPQGGPFSPLAANLLLDDLDKELEKRGHKFARYADDCNIYVKSLRAGRRVLASVSRFLERKLKLQINQKKSAVDRPWERVFLGFTYSPKRPHPHKVSEKAIKRFKARIKQITRRTRGEALRTVIDDLKIYIIGWKGYFDLAEVESPLRDLDKWIRRRLRCYLWKQWGKRGYQELRKLDISRVLAWNTAKSAHGPWRLSRSPALYRGLQNEFFAKLGLPSLVDA